jgi:alkanesulfonate monooxygenase SsuD/methylene tetrahydromethanopterin reductase-like flavin-dependent oxidoreductase (luciferase family)
LTAAPTKTISIADVISLVQLAEEHGYESVWIPETWGADAVSLLAALALSTHRIKLASGVFNVYSRSAALIAQTAASLQDLSGGRFILGLGASGPGVIERWHGLRYTRPVERTRLYVEIIRLALGGERVDHAGVEAALEGFRLSNPPEHPVPIYIAALGPKNVRLTGEVADGWLPIFAPHGHLGALDADLAQGARASGRDVAAIDVAAFLPGAIGPRADRMLRQQLAYYVGGMGTFYASFLSRLGHDSQVSAIRERWARGDRPGAVSAVGDDLLDICTLGSDPALARERLDQYRRDGLWLPIVALPQGSTVDEARETILALAPDRS